MRRGGDALYQLESTLKRRKKDAEEKIKERDAAIIKADKNKRVLREVKATIDEAGVDMSNEKVALAECTKKLALIGEELLVLQAKQKQLDGEIQKQTSVKTAAEKLITECTKDLQTFRETVSKQELIRSAAKRKLDKLRHQLDAETVAKKDCHRKFLLVEKDLRLLLQEGTSIQNRITATKKQLEVVSNDQYNSKKESDAIQKEIEALAAKQVAHSKVLAASKEKMIAEVKKLREAKEKVDSMSVAVKDIEVNVTVAQEAVDQLTSKFKAWAEQAINSKLKHDDQAHVASEQNAKAQNAKAAAHTMEQKTSEASQRSQKATSLHSEADADHKKKLDDLAVRMQNLQKTNQQAMEAAKKFEKAQSDLDARRKEQSEKRKLKDEKEASIKKWQEEQQRLEAQQQKRLKNLKNVATILTALAQVSSILAILNPKFELATLALTASVTLVQCCEKVVAENNLALQKAIADQNENNRLHGIDMTKEEQAQQRLLMSDIKRLNEACKYKEAVDSSLDADKAARDHMSAADQESMAERNLHNLSVHIAEQAKQADIALATQKDECQQKMRDLNHWHQQRKEAINEFADAERNHKAAESSVRNAEEALAADSTENERLASQNKSLEERMKLVHCTKSELQGICNTLEQDSHTNQARTVQSKQDENTLKVEFTSMKLTVKATTDFLNSEEEIYSAADDVINQCNARITAIEPKLVTETNVRDLADQTLNNLQTERTQNGVDIAKNEKETKLAESRSVEHNGNIKKYEVDMSSLKQKYADYEQESTCLQETRASCEASASSALERCRDQETAIDAHIQTSAPSEELSRQQQYSTTPGSHRNPQY